MHALTHGLRANTVRWVPTHAHTFSTCIRRRRWQWLRRRRRRWPRRRWWRTRARSRASSAAAGAAGRRRSRAPTVRARPPHTQPSLHTHTIPLAVFAGCISHGLPFISVALCILCMTWAPHTTFHRALALSACAGTTAAGAEAMVVVQGEERRESANGESHRKFPVKISAYRVLHCAVSCSGPLHTQMPGIKIGAFSML